MTTAGKIDKATNTLPAPETTGKIAGALGRFAFNHRSFFDGTSGHLLLRNTAKVIVGVIPCATTFLLTRMGLAAVDEKLAQHDSLSGLRHFTDQKNHPVGWQTSFIIGGFSVFRGFCKLWQRSYDRIFGAESATESAQAITNLPKQIWQDIKDISSAELGGTVVSAFPLAAVKAGFLDNTKFPIAKGGFEQAKKGYPNDYLASTLAYSAFFTLNDNLYNSLSGGKDSKKHYQLLTHKPGNELEALVADGNPMATFAKDNGVGRMVMNKIVPIALGVAPFIGLQRLSRAQFGQPDLNDKGLGGFARNLGKEYMQFAGFFTFTVTGELYNAAYEKLLGKLNAKQQQRGMTL